MSKDKPKTFNEKINEGIERMASSPIGSCYEQFEKDLAESFRDDDKDSLDYNNSEEENGE